MFCRERAPVGGISVKEHFEINVIPLTIAVTHAFFMKMLKFFFPGRDSDGAGKSKHQEKQGKNKKKMKRDESGIKSSANSSTMPAKSISSTLMASNLRSDEIDKMRERAQRNQTFVYIKISEVPIRVSYKGHKEKNIADINNFSLIIPTIEYHNQTWTWLDLLMALKNESKHRLLSQAVKQKLLIKPRAFHSSSSEEPTQPPRQEEEEEQKARLLLGNLATTSQPKSKGLSLFSKK